MRTPALDECEVRPARLGIGCQMVRACRDQRRTAIGCVAAALLLGGIPSEAHSGAVTSCSQPFVFAGDDVNTLILQYTYAGRPDSPLSDTAARLSALIQIDALLSQSKYGAVAVTQLLVQPGGAEECTPEIVAAQVLGDFSGTRNRVQDGKGLVILSGQIFEENNQILIQSFIDFRRAGRRETLELALHQSGAPAPAEFVADLPSTTLAFPPRRLTYDDVAEIQGRFEEVAVVRPHRSVTEAGEPIPLSLEKPFAYSVVGTGDGWVRIEPHEDVEGRLSGWVWAAGAPRDLRHWMPELDFLDAVVGYLRYRIWREGNGHSLLEEALDWIEASLTRFIENSGDVGRAAVPIATGKAMVGVLEILRNGFAATAAMEEETTPFEQAIALMPFSPNTRNLQALVDIYACCVAEGLNRGEEEAVDRLLGAVSIDPNNDRVLRNLETLYALLLQHSVNSDSCQWARDGECDEPSLCPAGTDTTDCRGQPAGPSAVGRWAAQGQQFGQQQRVDLQVRQALNEAQQAMQQGDMDEATRALAQAEQALQQVERQHVERPQLEQALSQANQAVQRGDYQAAGQALQRARQAVQTGDATMTGQTMQRAGQAVQGHTATTGGSDGCQWARDGECDEPSLCPAGTDTTDCQGTVMQRERFGQAFEPQELQERLAAVRTVREAVAAEQ